jgi:hypothetical protein
MLEKLHDLYSPNIFRTNTYGGMSWPGHVACTFRVWWGNLKEGFHMKVLATGERIILKWILKECNGR